MKLLRNSHLIPIHSIIQNFKISINAKSTVLVVQFSVIFNQALRNIANLILDNSVFGRQQLSIMLQPYITCPPHEPEILAIIHSKTKATAEPEKPSNNSTFLPI